MVWAGGLGALALAACGSPRIVTPAGATPDAATAMAPADAAPDAPGPVMVEWTTAPITLDGEWLERDWDTRTQSLAFRGDDGDQARPFSSVRFLRDATSLYVGLYAADEDIELGDFFQVRLGQLELRVHPRGELDASAPGVKAAVDTDGTIGDPSDDDEEWVVELGVPLALVAPDGAPIAMQASRCDITKDHVLRCGAADATLALAAP